MPILFLIKKVLDLQGIKFDTEIAAYLLDSVQSENMFRNSYR